MISTEILHLVARAVRKYGHIYISLSVKVRDAPQHVQYLVHTMPHMFYRCAVLSAWARGDEICINADGIVRCGSVEDLLRDRALPARLEQLHVQLARSGYNLLRELQYRYRT